MGCPFCGESRISLNKPNEFYRYGSINCPACLVTMPGACRDEEELIEGWNTREGESTTGIKRVTHEQIVEAVGAIRTREDALRLIERIFDLSQANERSSTGSVRDYIANYRFEMDGGGSYRPTAHEEAMIEDAIEGYIASLPQTVPMPAKTRPADCLDPMGCLWKHVPTSPEIGLHLCSRFGCPHTTSAGSAVPRPQLEAGDGPHPSHNHRSPSDV